MREIFIEGQCVAAVTNHAAKRLYRMRRTDLFNAIVTGQAQFGLIGQRRCKRFRRGQRELPERDQAEEEREYDRSEGESTVHTKAKFTTGQKCGCQHRQPISTRANPRHDEVLFI